QLVGGGGIDEPIGIEPDAELTEAWYQEGNILRAAIIDDGKVCVAAAAGKCVVEIGAGRVRRPAHFLLAVRIAGIGVGVGSAPAQVARQLDAGGNLDALAGAGTDDIAGGGPHGIGYLPPTIA